MARLLLAVCGQSGFELPRVTIQKAADSREVEAATARAAAVAKAKALENDFQRGWASHL